MAQFPGWGSQSAQSYEETIKQIEQMQLSGNDLLSSNLNEDELTLLRMLVNACSQDVVLVQQATIELQRLESALGSSNTVAGQRFYSCLLKLYALRDVDPNVRLLAILYFKNAIERIWRQRNRLGEITVNAPNQQYVSLGDSEKEQIRSLLLTVLQRDALAGPMLVQTAVVIGKIVRFESFRCWPRLLPTLVSYMQHSAAVANSSHLVNMGSALNEADERSSALQHRALFVFYTVMKTLASKRLVADRKVFEEVTEQVLPIVLTQFETHRLAVESLLRTAETGVEPIGETELRRGANGKTEMIRTSASGYTEMVASGTNRLERLFESLTACTRFSRILIQYGIRSFDVRSTVFSFLKDVMSFECALVRCMPALYAFDAGLFLVPRRDKLLIQLAKLMLITHEAHATSFARLVSVATRTVIDTTLRRAVPRDHLPDRFCVLSFNLLSAILNCEHYKLGRPPFAASTSSKSGESARAADDIAQVAHAELRTELFGEADASVKSKRNSRRKSGSPNNEDDAYASESLSDSSAADCDMDPASANAQVQSKSNGGQFYGMLDELVDAYMKIGEAEFDKWDAAPEEFALEACGSDQSEAYRASVRSAAETLFASLSKAFTEPLTQHLLHRIDTVMRRANMTQMLIANDLDAFIERDALYNAIGLCAYELFEWVRFNEWLAVLDSELLAAFNSVMSARNSEHPNANSALDNSKIVRRRTVWLVAQFAGVRIDSDAMRTKLYALLVRHLNDPDLVVRLEAAQSLKTIIDEHEFREECFVPYLRDICSGLFELLSSVVECETKMRVLSVIGFVIEHARATCLPYVSFLMKLIKDLWALTDADRFRLLRATILSTMQQLVKAIGTESVCLYDFLIPLINYATDRQQPGFAYLLEDGLDLWFDTLAHAPPLALANSISNVESRQVLTLLQLFANIPTLIDSGTEHLRTCLRIMEGYLLCYGQDFLRMHGDRLLSLFESLWNEVSSDGLQLIVRFFETACILFPQEGPLFSAPFLRRALETIMHGTDEYAVLISLLFSLVGRTVLTQPKLFFDTFVQVVSEANADAGSRQAASQTTGNQMAEDGSRLNVGSSTTVDEALCQLVHIWIERLDENSNATRRKVAVFALLSILASHTHLLNSLFNPIINACVDILFDCAKLVDPVVRDFVSHSSTYPYRSSAHTDYVDRFTGGTTQRVIPDVEDTFLSRSLELSLACSAHEMRANAMHANDPVERHDLRAFTLQKMNELRDHIGVPAFDACLVELIDSEIREQLEQLLTGGGRDENSSASS